MLQENTLLRPRFEPSALLYDGKRGGSIQPTNLKRYSSSCGSFEICKTVWTPIHNVE